MSTAPARGRYWTTRSSRSAASTSRKPSPRRRRELREKSTRNPKPGNPETRTMNYRRLGDAGVKLSEIGLGGWLTFGNAVEAEQGRRVMDAAWELGINFF